MTSTNSRIASLDVRLFLYWENMPPGRGVLMDEMAVAMNVFDNQAIRSSLTRLRKGRVRNPAEPDSCFRPLPIRWNVRDGKYYDLSNISGEAVLAHVPESVLSGAFSSVLTRVATLESSMGSDGMGRVAYLLDNGELRELLRQIPFEEIWRVQDYLQGISRAKHLLELREASQQLPSGQTAASGEG